MINKIMLVLLVLGIFDLCIQILLFSLFRRFATCMDIWHEKYDSTILFNGTLLEKYGLPNICKL